MFVTYPALEAMPFLQETKLTHELRNQVAAAASVSELPHYPAEYGDGRCR
jgi:hypothetical protein